MSIPITPDFHHGLLDLSTVYLRCRSVLLTPDDGYLIRRPGPFRGVRLYGPFYQTERITRCCRTMGMDRRVLDGWADDITHVDGCP